MSWPRLAKSLFLLFGSFLVLALGVWIFFIHTTWTETKVIFLSIGEGDAILITHGSEQILIDGGRTGDRLLEHLGKVMPFYDREIEAVIETHPDADHIGGFPALLTHYHVDHFLRTGAKSDTDTVRLLDETISHSKGTDILPAILGTNLALGEEGKLEVLFPLTPQPEHVAETNATSVVTRFTFGETSFLLTGDLPNEEDYLPTVPSTTILKAAHHGSHFSTSDRFLDLVQPKEVVISVGQNSYGHPSKEVMDRLRERNILTFRTDEKGDIVYHCRSQWNACRHEK